MTNPVQPPWRWQFVVAGLLILGFVVLTVFMLGWAGGSEGAWKNRVFVFSSVEAIVFTAVGWVFGREVHRSGVETAKQDAKEAKDEAKAKQAEAAEERAKGMKLAGAVGALSVPAGGGQASDVAMDEDGAPALSQLDRVRQMARELYG